MRKLVAFILPLVVTAFLFLVLFNNLNNGLFILFILIGLNLCLFLSVRSHGSDSPAFARLGSLCALSCLASVLVIELLFPVLLPKEYAEIRDLTKRFVGGEPPVSQGASVVFLNDDQKSVAGIALARTIGAQRSWHNPGGKFAYYGYDPNLKASYVNLFHWNSRGYYDHDYEPIDSEGAYRIAVIGDSYVEAVQVPLSRSFHKLIEGALNQTTGNLQGKRVQVLAFGNSGTGQVENFNVLRTQATEYGPNLVVLALSSNDFCDDDQVLKRDLVLASGTVTPLIRGLATHGCLAVAFAARRIEDLKRNRITISPELLQWSKEDLPRIESAWERTLNYIRLSREYCSARGVGFLLFYVGCDLEVKYFVDPTGTVSRLKAMGGPHRKINWDMGKSVRRVESFCHKNGIAFISLLDPMVAAQRQTGRYVFGDHYTMFGHQVAAQVLSCALAGSLHSDDPGALSLRACLVRESWQEYQPIGALASSMYPTGAHLVPASSTGLPAQ